MSIQKYKKILSDLFVMNRNIVSDGNLEALEYIDSIYDDLEIYRFKSGSDFYDWKVPKSWKLNKATIKNSNGDIILSHYESPMSVVFCSSPTKLKIKGSDLIERLHTNEFIPDAIPYRQSTYENKWGFCVNQKFKESLESDEIYEVHIDSEFTDGELLAGELKIEGETKKEIILTSYMCHPSQAHDGLSGVIMLLMLYDFLNKRSNKFTYRFLFFPETIGSICLLGSKKIIPDNVEYSLVSTCVGRITNLPVYKSTFLNNHSIDNIVRNLFDKKVDIRSYYPFGSDERQLSSPGIEIPASIIMGDPFGEFDEYHTDRDNLDFINWKDLEYIFKIYKSVILEYEKYRKPIYLLGGCEPMLGKRNLYSVIGNSKHTDESILRNWILHLANGKNNVLDISLKSGFTIELIERYCKELAKHGIIKLV
jgi:aminopeptidase-like protein